MIMADSTDIEWARHPVTGHGATWNPVTGCELASPGCTNCYAMKLAGTRLRHHPSRAGLTIPGKKGPVWTGEVRFNERWLSQPLRWTAPRGIFVAAHGDLFADGVTDAMLDLIFAVMAFSTQHVFFVLTKRPERMRAYLTTLTDAYNGGGQTFTKRIGDPAADVANSPCAAGAVEENWPLHHVWLGTSVESQEWADRRRQPMQDLSASGWTTFVSYEPAIGQVDWTGWQFLRWLISGGESGPRASHPDWHRAARDFCRAHRIAYFFKQWGNWSPAPWKLDRLLGESDDDYKARSENLAATHAIRCWDGYVHKPDHKPWSIERAMIDKIWAGIRHHKNKKAAGRLLDGVEHNGFPRLEG